MGDVVDLYDYWRTHPPTHLILQAVHAKEPPHVTAAASTITHQELLQQISEAQNIAGGALGTLEKMPDRLADLASWADEQTAKLKHA
jgi:hypothetical protein